MNENERDTHFQGAAQILMSRLNTEGFDEDGYRSGETTQKIIAQFLYDFASYVVEEVQYPHVQTVPDLTEWPKY